MKVFFTALLYFLLVSLMATGQVKPIDKVQFFTDTNIFPATLVAPMGKVINRNPLGKNTFTGRFRCRLPDSTAVDEQIVIETRGHFRKEYCYLPPLKLTFNIKDAAVLAPLKSLKLVSACKLSSRHNQYILKEYLIYRIYNLLTEKSFRVRLLDLEYLDSSGKKKPVKEYAFFIEDVKEMAKRNNAKEWTDGRPHTESVNRELMTLTAVFEYMIGNTDWSVPVRHNIKTIRSRADTTERPFAVPYDFDYSGLVNTEYAIPDEMLNTSSVLERVYRGFPRTMEELNEVLELFKKQKENIYSLINNFNLLTPANKKSMIEYLESFYSLLKKPKDVKYIFIDNARTD